MNRRFGEAGVEKEGGLGAGKYAPDSRIPESGDRSLLFVLHESGYAPPYLGGLDYGVNLVQLVAAWSRNTKDVTFYVCDFLENPSHGQRFDFQG